MQMKMSSAGIQMLVTLEGIDTTIYSDVVGIQTGQVELGDKGVAALLPEQPQFRQVGLASEVRRMRADDALPGNAFDMREKRALSLRVQVGFGLFQGEQRMQLVGGVRRLGGAPRGERPEH